MRNAQAHDDFNLDDEDAWEVLYEHPFDNYDPEETLESFNDDYSTYEHCVPHNVLTLPQRPLIISWDGVFVVLEKYKKESMAQASNYYEIVATSRKHFCEKCDVIKNAQTKAVKYRFLVSLDTFCAAVKASHPGVEVKILHSDSFIDMLELVEA